VSNTGSPTNVTVRGLTLTDWENWPVNPTNASHAWLSCLKMANSGNSPEFAIASSDCRADHPQASGIADEGFVFYGGPVSCDVTNATLTGNSAAWISVLNDSGQPAPSSGIGSPATPPTATA
jgi:hypothetical protein